MGWCGGSIIMSDIITATNKYGSTNILKRTLFYKECIKSLENADWDNQQDCLGEDLAYDMALLESQSDAMVKE